MSQFLRCLIFLAVCLGNICLSTRSVLGQVSKPIILSVPPNDYVGEDYGVSPQNWGIIQLDDGRVFVGNNSGVLVWDGNSWEMVHGTENKRFFKFAEGPGGKIYTGGIDEIGRIGADSLGQIEFVSLKDQLPDNDFQQIFRVDSDEERVYFLGGEYLFVLKDDSFTVFKDPERFVRVLTDYSEVFVTSRDRLFKFKGDSLQLLDTDAQIIASIRGISSSTKSNDEGEYLVVTNVNGIFSLEGNRFTRLENDFALQEVFNITHLNDGAVALGTNGQGLILMDDSGAVTGIINEESGLLNSQVPFPYKGKYGGLWLCLYSGICRVDYQSPIQLYDLDDGLISPVISLYGWRNHTFIGTTEGPYFIEDTKSNLLTKIEVESKEVYGFFELDGKLWMAANHGLYRIDDDLNFSLEFGSLGLDGFCRSHSDSTKIYTVSGGYNLKSIVYANGQWDFGPDSLMVPHIISKLIEGEEGEIWVAGENISVVSFAGDSPEIQNLGLEQGLEPDMGLIELRKVGEDLLVCGVKGLFSWNYNLKRLVPYKELGEQFTGRGQYVYNLTPISDGDFWLTSNEYTGRLELQKDGSYQADSLPLAAVPISDYFTIYEDDNGIIWLGGTEGLVRYDPKINKDYRQPYFTLIRRVTVNSDSIIFHGTFSDEEGRIIPQQPEAYIPTLPFEGNHLTFSFAAPFYEAREKLRFSHQLIGQESKWTPWTNKTEAEYTNLREGDYTFRVRARNAYGTISEVAEYRFSILAPWYRTIWAYITYGLLAILGVVGIVRLNTRRLVAAKRRLEGVVADRTEKIQRQMEQLAEQKEIISKEMELSESLLLNILPKETSEELKEKGTANPKQFEHVSVLFTDFKGFTQIAEQLSPRDLVAEIHECFSEFDRITYRYGIEKIKTIGDAYMAAGGLPTVDLDNPVKVVRAALEIRDYMEAYKKRRTQRDRLAFEIRLGIHTGPVVAGIVGTKKFQYDIWGDTVNVAARMESSGEVGRVNISEATYELVKEHFDCTYRGKVMAKNKGEIAMYFVEWKEGDGPGR